MKDKNYKIILIDAEKAFDKIQHSPKIKTLNKVGIEGMYLNLIKTTYDKPAANFILNGEKLKAFPLRWGTRQAVPPPLSFSIVLKVLAIAIRQEKEVKSIQIGKKEVKLSLFADDMILIYRKPQRLHQKTLRINNKFNKIARYKINIQKLVMFLYTNNKLAERGIRRAILLIVASKRI